MTHYNKQCMTTVDVLPDIAEATASCFNYVWKYQRIKYISRRNFFLRASETNTENKIVELPRISDSGKMRNEILTL